MSPIRINKYLSLCGVTSRRGAERLIKEQRVALNAETVTVLGTMIDPENDVVKVDGTEVKPVLRKVYLAMNKPRMTMTTLHDPFRRRTVLHHLKRLEHRVYPVGRLDYDVEGLLLLTNDGDLAFRLTHPRYKVTKVYEAMVQGKFSAEGVKLSKAGIKLEDGAIGRAEVSILGFVRDQSRIRLVLTEGRKREVKQLCKKVGHPVERLCRVEFGDIQLKGLKSGQWRYLTSGEVTRLQERVGLT